MQNDNIHSTILDVLVFKVRRLKIPFFTKLRQPNKIITPYFHFTKIIFAKTTAEICNTPVRLSTTTGYAQIIQFQVLTHLALDNKTQDLVTRSQLEM